METPRFWPITTATVTSVDPDNYRVNVALDGFGGQGPAIPVAVVTPGPRDGVRGTVPELPTPGTRGLVCFPRGDSRNGHWMGATEAGLNDASTLTATALPTHYHAAWSGAWWYHGPDGSTTLSLPNGSYVAFGTVPSPTRHVVTSGQVRTAAPYAAAQRVSGTPAVLPFRMAVNGAAIAVDASGGVALQAAPGQALSLSVSGGGSAMLNADGSVTVLAAAGKTVTVSAGGGTLPLRRSDGSVTTVLTAE